MKKPKRSSGTAIDFWQSGADLFLGLLLTLFLVIALLLLYLLQLPETERFELWGTQADYHDWDGDYDPDGDTYERGNKYDDNHYYTDYGGGGDGNYEERYLQEKYPYPTAGGGDGDEWAKAAVYTTVTDAETGRAIKQENVKFELYQIYDSRQAWRGNQQGAIRYLYNYYPVKTEYRDYGTTENGNFYLPEKVEEGGYYFKELSEPEGYDSADLVYFEIDDDYDWNDPFVVSVPLYPSRNVVRIQLMDMETGLPIEDGAFEVRASEDIFTADGTRRFIQSELADTVTIGEEGLGISTELYLGNYTVAQSVAPKYYTIVEGATEVAVEKKNGSDPEPLEYLCEKTAISLRVVDDLYANVAVEGAVFSLTAEEENALPRYGTTDSSGSILFTNLEKNTVYRLRQESAPGDYKRSEEEYRFIVDGTGRISGEAKATAALTNFIPRVAIGVQDILLKGAVTGQTVSLYSSDGSLIRTWRSSGVDEIFTDLAAGNYYLLINDKVGSKRDFTVDDAEGINDVSISVWSMQSILSLAVAVVALLLVIYLIVLISRKLFRRKTNYA